MKQKLAFLLLLGLALAACTPTESTAPSAAGSSPAPASSAASVPAESLPAGVSPLGADWPEAEVFVDEDMYVNWVNELNWNCDLYLEKTVRIQGMYTSETPEALDAVLSYVYRVGPGCCGTDGDLCGLQIVLPADAAPAEGDWIDVYGTLRIVELDGFKFLALEVSELAIDNDHRGLENVLHQI